MGVKLLAVFLFLGATAVSSGKIDPKNLRCLVCRTTLMEFEIGLRKIDPRKTVEVGNYRLDPSGNMHQNRVPLGKSEAHMSEMLDEICKKLNDYVRVTFKATGKLAVMELMGAGGMNPDLSSVNFITDSDLNKSLEFYCSGVLEENEDNIVKLYASREDDQHMPDGVQEICFKQAELCEDWMMPDDADRDWSNEKEMELRQAQGSDPYGFGGMPNVEQESPSDFGEFDDAADDVDQTYKIEL